MVQLTSSDRSTCVEMKAAAVIHEELMHILASEKLQPSLSISRQPLPPAPRLVSSAAHQQQRATVQRDLDARHERNALPLRSPLPADNSPLPPTPQQQPSRRAASALHRMARQLTEALSRSDYSRAKRLAQSLTSEMQQIKTPAAKRQCTGSRRAQRLARISPVLSARGK
jgi:hypothetical protein